MSKRKKPMLSLILVTGFFIYFIITLIEQQRIINFKNNEAKNIRAKIQSEMQLNEELKKFKENLYSDEYIEKIAREKLGMVKPGEKIFFDIDK
ncbi:MAG TPA: septum formation initiator family protein [Clostridiaceae bacterium]|nr:septum formation initiator family protein [Clostridiaceae bacterium]